MNLDWSNPLARVSTHFSVQDCLFLHKWNRMATIEDGLDYFIKNNLLLLCNTLDKIINDLGIPFNVHSMYRPPEYSLLVGGTKTDVHTLGVAIDFDSHPIYTTDEVKSMLISVLPNYGIRMENNGKGASWIHIDNHPVGHNRFFIP